MNKYAVSIGKPLFCLVTVLMLCAPVFGKGLQETPYEPTEGGRNWEREFDLTGRKPGKYNVVVESRDSAGNATLAGPINVYVDPNSDLPVITLANPLAGMIVRGDLNIVGTCVDDDAVGRVEVSIDGGEWVAAVGTDFWQLYVKAGTLEDGYRVIRARGVDVNGLTGREYSVGFNMDKNKPLATVDSHKAAQLVAGKIILRGNVFDANGVQSVEFSLDNGATWIKTKGNYDKKTMKRDFQAPVDTTKLPDGPTAILFRSVDGCGLMGITPFLLVVDNTKPEVDLVVPAADEAVDGDFVLFGVAGDGVGLAALSWSIGDLRGDLALTPGDPYWTVPVSIANLSAKTLQLVVTARDTIGNVTELRKTINVNLEKDKPLVTLQSPLAGKTSEGRVILAGFARDDDGIAAVEYWLDGAQPTAVETTGSFQIPVEGIAAGNHTLSVRAKDINGVTGPVATVAFADIGPAPTLSIGQVSFTRDGQVVTEPFVMGQELAPDAKVSLVAQSSGGSAVASLAWKIADRIEGSIANRPAGDQTWSIPLPEAGPFGLLPVELTLTDVAGRTAKAVTAIYLTNYSKIRSAPQFVFEDERIDADGKLRFGPGRQPLVARFVGANLAKVALEPATKDFSVTQNGAFVQVNALNEAVAGPFVLVGTTDRGHTFRSTPITLISDATGPAIELTPLKTRQVGKTVTIAGRIKDSLAIQSVSWSASGREGAITLAKDGSFTQAVDLAAVEDGSFPITVIARDTAGNESQRSLALYKDTTGPTFVQLLPNPNVSTAFIAGSITDLGGLASVSYAADGATFAPIENPALFAFPFAGDDPSKARIKAVDRNGNENVFPVENLAVRSDVTLSEAPDPKAVPRVEILYPGAGTVSDSSSILVFRVYSVRALGAISWTFGIQKGEFAVADLIPQGDSWIGYVPVQNFMEKPGAIQANVTVRDAANKSGSAAVRFSCDPAKQNPAAAIVAPTEGQMLRGAVDLLVSGSSQYGVNSFEITVDSGAPVAVETQGSALLSLEQLSVGVHTVTVTTTDTAGRVSAPIKRSFKVTGEAPAIKLGALATKDSSVPFETGMTAVLADGMAMTGTVLSPNGLSAVKVAFAGREAVGATLTKVSETEYSYTLPLPAGLPYDRISVRVSATDPLGQSSEKAGFFYRLAPEVPETAIFDAEGLRSTDARISSAQNGSFIVTLHSGDIFRVRFMGRPLASAQAGDGTGFLSVSVDGQWVNIAATKDGASVSAPLRVKTVDGDQFTWGPVAFIADLSDPLFEVLEPAQDAWYKGEAPFKARFSDPNGIASVQYSLDGETWQDIALDQGKDVRAGKLPLTMDDGGVVAHLRVTDKSGRATTVIRSFNKDTVAPVGRIVLPREGDKVNGRTTSGASFSDNGALESLEFSDDGGKTWIAAERLPTMTRTSDFSALGPNGKLLYRAKDKAGNVTDAQPAFTVDYEADKPRVVIQLPGDNEVLREDYAIAGAVYDDDGVDTIIYRVDSGEWITQKIESNTFSLPFALADSLDNEHVFEAYAVDMYGVKGEPSTRKFRISKEEPKAEMVFPPLDRTVRGIVDLSGIASDKNGVRGLMISFDNSASFNVIVGTDKWTYRLDTTNLRDGLHSIYIKPMDNYDTEGFYATLISIDNTAPEIALDLPGDGSTSDVQLQLSGRVSDDQYLDFCEAVVFSRADGKVEKRFPLALEPVISNRIDLTGLPNGEYGVRIVARDRAGNETISSRDFILKAGWRDDAIYIATPVHGEKVGGLLRVQGHLRSAAMPTAVTLLVNGTDAASVAPDKYGWFAIDLDPATLKEGAVTLAAQFVTADGKTIVSDKVNIDWAASGSWIATDNFTGGAFVPERPWLKGRAGWTGTEAENLAPDGAPLDKKLLAERDRGRQVVKVEVSLDNGRTWQAAEGSARWRFRLETLSYREGPLPLVLRATYRNGATAVSKVLLNLDKTPPEVALLYPQAGDRLNQSFRAFGTAEDDVELASVEIALRTGDKSGYELPGFIQGLSLEGGYGGETQWNVGLGLTFFNDVVKVQAQYGYLPTDGDPRFYGNVLSGKLLASIFDLPFSYLLGPDFRVLSANLSLGAKVSYFFETAAGTPLLISAVVAQIEFPKLTFKSLKAFSSYSMYWEYQAWLISAEVEGGVESRVSGGLRIYLF